MNAAVEVLPGVAPVRRGPVMQFITRLFREKPVGAAAGVVFILFLLCGIFAPWLAPFGYNEISPINRLKPPSWQYPLVRTTLVGTCCRAAYMAPSFRSSSACRRRRWLRLFRCSSESLPAIWAVASTW